MSIKVKDASGKVAKVAGRGLPGPAGKSAYQYAVDGGYTGTEEEFQALLGSGPWVAEAGYVPSSNHNLLYNWYLKDPVNQRGKTEYSGSVYGVDMWKNLTSITNQKIEADGITVGRISGSASGSTKNICQLVEDLEWMAGKTFTASALVSRATGVAQLRIHDVDNKLYSGASVSKYEEGPFLLSTTFTLPSELNGLMFVLRSAGTVEDISATFAAAKLELGTEQTLAHQDDSGSWVLNDPPPNKALELIKCQRYQQVLNVDSYASHQFGMGIATAADQVRVIYPFPMRMAKRPAIVTEGAFKLSRNMSISNANSIDVTDISLVSLDTQAAVLRAYGTVEVGGWYALIPNASDIGRIILDANL